MRFPGRLLLLALAMSLPARAEVTDAPALDFSGLSASAHRELDQVLGDEFCGCGAPHTLQVCVRTHPACQHSRRLAQLAASLAEQGATGSELGVFLARYRFMRVVRVEVILYCIFGAYLVLICHEMSMFRQLAD